MPIQLLPLIIVLFQYPQTFDLRDVGGDCFITPVRNQTGGTCWAHGTMASLESNLLITGNWEAAGESGEPDLAEYHLDWWNGFNAFWNPDLAPPMTGITVHEGGDYLISVAYTSRGDGAVRDLDGQSFAEPPAFNTTLFHHYIPLSVSWITVGWDLESLEGLKDALMTGGAIATCIYSSSTYLSDDFVHYQPESSTEAPTHAVAIVGWNDTLETEASIPGAWLCKNSWGVNWGLDGYFWVSYWDKWAGRDNFLGAVSFTDVQLEPFTKALYHDLHGWRDTFEGLRTAMNAFVADEKCLMDMVSFYTSEDSVYFDIELYSTMQSGSPEGLLSSQSGLAGQMGFHTVELGDSVTLSSGDSIYVLLDLSSGGHPFDRTADVPILLGSNMDVIVASAASPGESYYQTQRGWEDFWYWTHNPYPGTGNFCIKLLGSWTGLHVFPEHSYHVTSESGTGPFYPEEVSWTVVYSGSDAAEYSITCDSDWLSISGSTSGVIQEGDTLSVIASPLPFQNVGGDTLYVASILFENISDPQNSITREVVLSIKERELLCTWPLNTDPGWEMDGEWAWGVPQGEGGNLGSPDPLSGYSGQTVLGYNLSGNYADGMTGYRFMAMETFSCQGATDVQLRYKRWLGVGEDDLVDIVGTSDFGASGWQTVWTNSSQPVYDSSWVNCVHNISGIADGNETITIVWLIGPSSLTGSECGWNIDDIEIWGSTVEDGVPVVPESSLMGRVFPNPAFESASVYCRVLSESNLLISVYDLSGRLVQTLFDGQVNPGLRLFTLDLGNLPSGCYMIRSEAAGETSASRFLKL